MPEIRVTIPEKMNKLLEILVETGLFTSKADLMRFAMVAYLNELGWIEKFKDSSD
jgi:Arc/MetJ-type ribon-helix-helix transcriptional regulator